MWIILFDQYVTVESSHLRNCKHSDRSEGFCSNRKYFSLCNISTKYIVRCTLQSVECDISRFDVSLKCSLCNLDWKRSCHDHLIFHFAESKFAGSCISTMESHKCIFLCIWEFCFNALFIHICRYCIIDVEECNCILADNSSDELAECSVNINLTGYRDSLCCQTAVYITWNESELCLECRPAFSCACNVFSVSSVLLNPVFQSNLILSQFRKDLRFLISCSELFFHLFYNGRNSLITFMFVISLEKVKFRVFLNFNSDIVKLLDWCITCKEV